MSDKNKKASRRVRIKAGIRKRVTGSAERPRLSVFRSNSFIYAQLINDDNGVTFASFSSAKKEIREQKVSKTEASQLVGKKLAEIASASGVSAVVFDRNGFKYHGRIKALAEGAREGGLVF